MSHPIRRRAVLGGLATLGGLAANAAGTGAEAAVDTIPLTFLHFNDVYRHGPIDGFGGLAEMATLLDAERAAAHGPVFQTFGGDVLSPSLASSVTHGAHMVALLNALGTDVAVIGNHELDFGSENAAAQLARANHPWLGANVLGVDGRPFGPLVATAMKEAAGLRIGFAGVLTRDTARLNPHADGITFTDEAAALAAAARDLRAAGADLVIAMTHLPLEADLVVARTVPGIDLILGGHDHDPMELQNIPGVPILKSASDARWLAVAVLRVQRPEHAAGTAARVRSIAWKLVPNVDVDPSPRIQPLIAAIDAKLDGVMNQPIARLDTPLDSRTGVVRGGEAALGNLVTDALRTYFAADVALTNGGGLRGDHLYPAGHVLTRRDLVAEMPFGNAVMKLSVTGATLAMALEHGLSGLPAASGRFPQVSGLAFSFDPAAPQGHRLGPVLVGGQTLDPTRTYTLATVDYLAAGGDGYTMLTGGTVLVDASGGPLLVNVVAEYATGARHISAIVEGRARRQS